MKIAITCENDTVFQHFGHTPGFAIFETVPGKIVSESRISSGDSGHGALATVLAAEKIDLLICGGISFALIALMIAIGIGIPARKAMKIDPAEALHNE